MESRPLSSSSSEPSKHSRRSHRKSRTGCRNCKKRKIKCDEAKPECLKCGAFGVRCDYVTGADPLRDAPLERSLFLNTQGPQTQGRRGRPRTRLGAEWLAVPSSSGTGPSRTSSAPAFPATGPQPSNHLGSPSTASLDAEPLPTPSTDGTAASTSGGPSTQQPAAPGPSANSSECADELRLLHHYLTQGYRGPDGRLPSYDAFRLQAPILGFECPFVLHFVYEFAALDYARTQPPERRQHYRELAAHYSTIGLQGLTDALPEVHGDKCHAIYTAAVFACMNCFARGPQPGDYLLFSENGPPHWLPLLRGVRTIVELMGLEKMAAGPDGDRPVDPNPSTSESAVTAWNLDVQLDWTAQFDRLEALVQTTGGPDYAMNAKALDNLRMSYQATYGGTDGAYQGEANYQNLFVWTYRLEEEFTQFLQERRQVSLIIFAHFGLLFKSFEFIWYLQGWSDHIINGCQKFLDDSHREWLQWPIEQARMMDSAIQAQGQDSRMDES